MTLVAVGMVGVSLLAAVRTASVLARPAPEDDGDFSPGIAVSVSPDRAHVYPGDTVTLMVTVVNTGDRLVRDTELVSALDGMTAGPPTPDGCDRKRIGALAPGRSARYACSVRAPQAVFRYGVRATARTSTGTVVSDSTTIAVGGVRAALSASMVVAPWLHRPGESIAFRVVLRNDGEVPVNRISALNVTFPGCSRGDLGTLAPGQERGYHCAGVVPMDDVTTAVVATGWVSDQPQIKAVSSVVGVDVVHPALVVTATRGRRGAEVTVTNVGDLPLSGVRTLAPDAPDCADPELGDLRPGTSVRFRCHAASGTVTATGSAGTGPEVTHAVDLGSIGRGALVVTQRVSRTQPEPGAPVTYSVTVRNTGSAAMRRVVLRDPVFSACDGLEFGRVAAGRSVRRACTVAAPAEDVIHVAIAVGEPDGSPPDTAGDSRAREVSTGSSGGVTVVPAVSKAAALDVVHAALAVTLTADPGTAFTGEPVTWSLTVANIGDVAIRGVTAESMSGECGERVGRLGVDDAPVGIQCSVRAGNAAVTNVVTVTGRLPSGDTVTEVAMATVRVQAGEGPGGRGARVPYTSPSGDSKPEGRSVGSASDAPAGGPGAPTGGPGSLRGAASTTP